MESEKLISDAWKHQYAATDENKKVQHEIVQKGADMLIKITSDYLPENQQLASIIIMVQENNTYQISLLTNPKTQENEPI